MNEFIPQQLPLFDAGAQSRQVERSQQQKKIMTVTESERTHGKNESTGLHEERSGGAEDLAEKIEQLNVQMQDMRRGLRFSVDDNSGRIVVKVIDLSTEEVIRQIPSEEMMALLRHSTDGESLLFSGEA